MVKNDQKHFCTSIFESLVSIRQHWLWSHKVDRTMVYSPELGRLQLGQVTGLSGYTRISTKVQYVTGTSQSLYQEQDNGVIIDVQQGA